MSIGELLDSAAAHLTAAKNDILAETQPQTHHVAAALAARDLIYLELTRMTALIRNRPPPSYLTWADAHVLLGPDLDGGTIDPATVLAAALHVARLRRDLKRRDLSASERITPDRMTRATRLLAAASEVIATHFTPSPAPSAQRHSGDEDEAVYRTAEGAALSRGTHRREALAEIARFACLAVKFDQTLLLWRSPANQDPLHAWQWRHLHRWVASGFPNVLAAVGSHSPATLLRELDPAPFQGWPSGPRTIESLPDIRAAIDAARMGVRHHRSAATVGLVREIARLGFALIVAASRANGETGALSQETEHHGEVWRALAAITTKVSDIREQPDAAMRLELRSSATWLRDQLRTDTPIHEYADHRQLLSVQRDLQKLCLEVKPPLRAALAYRHLMTPTKALTLTIVDAVRVAQTVWHTATYDHPHIAELHRRLHTASALSLALQQSAPAARSTELSGQTTGQPWIDVAPNRSQPATSIAYPHPTNRPLSEPDRSSRYDKTPSRQKPLSRDDRQR